MTFRKEDHQALQRCTTSRSRSIRNVAWAIPELVREIKIEDMKHPDPQQALSQRPARGIAGDGIACGLVADFDRDEHACSRPATSPSASAAMSPSTR